MAIAKISDAAGAAGEPLTPGRPALPGSLTPLLQHPWCCLEVPEMSVLTGHCQRGVVPAPLMGTAKGIPTRHH